MTYLGSDCGQRHICYGTGRNIGQVLTEAVGRIDGGIMADISGRQIADDDQQRGKENGQSDFDQCLDFVSLLNDPVLPEQQLEPAPTTRLFQTVSVSRQ